jgi:hypothetical protein
MYRRTIFRLSAITGLGLASAAMAQNGLPNQQATTATRQFITEIIALSSKPQCDVASPTKPCKGNNGFGNGGGDGSPNGKEDVNR